MPVSFCPRTRSGGSMSGRQGEATMAAAELNPSESRIEAEVRRARGLMDKRQFAPALLAAEALLAEVPENRDVLYILAACQRYLGRIADALATLRRLEQLHPQYARLFQERGHCHRTLGLPARRGFERSAPRHLEGAARALAFGRP
jgi:Flp pilus assembly protein TadD